MAADDPNGGAGGGSGGGFNDDQVRALQSLISTQLNSALSQRDRLSQRREQTQLESLTRLLDEKLSALKPQQSQGGDGGEGGDGKNGAGKNKNGGGTPQDNAEVQTLKRQMLELTKRYTDTEQYLSQERKKNRDTNLVSKVAEVLGSGPAPIEGQRFRAAFAYLQQQGRIRYASDESDDILYADDTGEIDFVPGLRTWMKSDDAKIFLPPSGANGSGSYPRRSVTPRSGPMGKEDQLRALDQRFANWAEEH